MAADHLEHQRGVGDGVGERADLVEAAGERDQPVAADARRRWASRRRRRTAPPAGGSSRRCRCRAPTAAKPAATAAALPPLDPPGTRVGSCGLRVGPNAEFSVLEPIANSSRLVLPIEDRAGGRAAASTTVASYGGCQPSRILDEHVVGMPRVHMLSLSATGTPASGPGSRPAATAASIAVGRGARLVGEHEVEGVDLGLARGDRGEVLARRTSTAVDARRPRTAAAISIAVAPRQPSSPMIGGTRNRPSSAAGRRGEHLVAVEAGALDVVAQHVGERVRLGHRLDVGEVERVDVGEVVEHVAELDGRRVELVGASDRAGRGGRPWHVVAW